MIPLLINYPAHIFIMRVYTMGSQSIHTPKSIPIHGIKWNLIGNSMIQDQTKHPIQESYTNLFINFRQGSFKNDDTLSFNSLPGFLQIINPWKKFEGEKKG